MELKFSGNALHEAGHAVVAAHLRVPFTHVTIKPRTINGIDYGGYVRTGRSPVNLRRYVKCRNTDACRARSEEEIVREVKRQVNNQVIVSLAGRAADEMPGLDRESTMPEECYAGDEETIKALTQVTVGTVTGFDLHINVAGHDFQAWRTSLLNRAKEIVAIPYIREAIIVVARQLYREYQVAKKGLPSKEIRRTLRWFKHVVND